MNLVNHLSKGRFLFCLVAVVCCIGSPAWAAGDPLSGQTDKFKFMFRAGPLPGQRTWVRAGGGDTWTETLPNKATNTFKVIKPFTYSNMDGALLVKVGEPDFFVFLPNLTIKRAETGKMQIWCMKGAKGKWTLLGTMTDISPSFM
jgi:hypothetical protein